jgi:hypothetical protein
MFKINTSYVYFDLIFQYFLFQYYFIHINGFIVNNENKTFLIKTYQNNLLNIKMNKLMNKVVMNI